MTHFYVKNEKPFKGTKSKNHFDFHYLPLNLKLVSPDKTILIIDDDEDDRKLFGEALAEADGSYCCVQIGDGEKGLELLKNAGAVIPSFIFLDLNMPRMNGWQCLLQLRKMTKLKDVPIIIYTTSSADADEQKAKQNGATYFLTKPSKFKDLVHAIFYVLNQKGK